MESRSAACMSGVSTNGNRPPTVNIMRQSAGDMSIAIKLTTAPPNGMALYASATFARRRCAALRSFTSATSAGNAPPSPSPVRRRRPISDWMLHARPVQGDGKDPEQRHRCDEQDVLAPRRHRRAGRRPVRRMNSPKVLALKKVPIRPGAGWNSATISAGGDTRRLQIESFAERGEHARDDRDRKRHANAMCSSIDPPRTHLRRKGA